MARSLLTSGLLVLSFATLALAQPNPPAYRLYGVNFSPYVNGQDPNQGATVSEAQLTQRMTLISPYTEWIRTFGSTNGLEKSGAVARSLNLKTAIGAWISKDTAANQREVDGLVAAAQAGQVDIAIVGSEVLLRGDLSEAALIALIQQVRQRIPAGIPVATADTYNTFLQHPNLIAAVDKLLVNYYPFWEGYSAGSAVAVLHQWHVRVKAAAGAKEVIVSETGWPSSGNTVGNAVPSPQNAAAYFLNFVSWARANQVKYFYFEAFDEAWKALYEGPVGQNWGIWNKDGVLKAGFAPVFQGQTAEDTWTLLNGPGVPGISFIFVPPYSSTLPIEGRVTHVNPADYQVAVYINTQGGWWTKPTFAEPATTIQPDGTFQATIVTGGNDALANRVAAFLIPKTFTPPPLSGNLSFPQSLTQAAVANVEAVRTTSAIFGRVTTADGAPVGGVNVAAAGNPSVLSTTGPSGYYSFPELLTSLSYIVSGTSPSHVFSPASVTVNGLSGVQQVNFTATPLPGAPAFPEPASGSAQISVNPTLTWQGGNGATSFDVYFGVNPNPPFAVNVTGNTYAPGPLAPSTTYFWRVVGKNANGSITSAEWNFRTLTPAAPAGSGLRFVPVTPCRLVDTRADQQVPQPFGPPALAPATVRTFVVPEGRCDIPATAKAYSLNVTVVPPGQLIYLTLWPFGQPQPIVSTLNSFDGRVVANAAIVPAGNDGAINVYATNATELILDINGYFAQSAAQ